MEAQIRKKINRISLSVIMKQFTQQSTTHKSHEALRSKTSKTFFPLEKKRHQQAQFLLRVSYFNFFRADKRRKKTKKKDDEFFLKAKNNTRNKGRKT